jgi:hypothetical protein
MKSVPVAAPSKAWVCGRLLAVSINKNFATYIHRKFPSCYHCSAIPCECKCYYSCKTIVKFYMSQTRVVCQLWPRKGSIKYVMNVRVVDPRASLYVSKKRKSTCLYLKSKHDVINLFVLHFTGESERIRQCVTQRWAVSMILGLSATWTCCLPHPMRSLPGSSCTLAERARTRLSWTSHLPTWPPSGRGLVRPSTSPPRPKS